MNIYLAETIIKNSDFITINGAAETDTDKAMVALLMAEDGNGVWSTQSFEDTGNRYLTIWTD